MRDLVAIQQEATRFYPCLIDMKAARLSIHLQDVI